MCWEKIAAQVQHILLDSYAAHCIDLMLESFANPRYFSIIDQTIQKARKVTKFIYNHAWVEPLNESALAVLG